MPGLYSGRAATRKRRRLVIALAAMGVLALASVLVFRALDQTMLYFRMPSDVMAETPPAGERFRLGGLVADGSFRQNETTATAHFAVSDGEARLPVLYTGILPDLFREGQGVIADGALGVDGVFHADTVLAKHDENYMPPEVYERIREQGHPGRKTAER